MLKKPISALEEARRDTSFMTAEVDSSFPEQELWGRTFDRIARMFSFARPPWIGIGPWRRAMKNSVYGHRGMFWNLFCFLERALEERHETVNVTIGGNGAGTGNSEGDVKLTATGGFKFTNRHVGRFIRLTPVEPLDGVNFQPEGEATALAIDHPYRRQEDVLVYATGGGSEDWKIIEEPGVDTLSLAIHGVYGTRFKTNFFVQDPIAEGDPNYDEAKGFQIIERNYGGAVFNTKVDPKGLSPNEVTKDGVVEDYASNYFWLPKGTYKAKFLGFSIEELTGNYIALLKHGEKEDGSTETAGVKMGNPADYSKVKIILYYTDLDQLPATYLQGDDGPADSAEEEESPPNAVGGAWTDALPFGGQIQGDAFEPGNNSGEGPFPIYLDGTGQGADFGLLDVIEKTLVAAGVKVEFAQRDLLDFKE